MINAAQFRNLVVVPALEAVELHSPAAEALVMGTAAQESRLRYLRQLGNGPALGLFQMEPATYYDIWQNYLAHRDELAGFVRKAIQYSGGTPVAERMIWDLRLAAIMCRLHYRRVPEPLPDAEDVHELGRYWKQYYNTSGGAGTAQEFVDHFALVQ